ncbi:GPO family capsid scaffolding protein [Pseudomonas aeruginosa]
MAASTAPAKKIRSKKFRIAVEGGTTDGREIQRSWIEDMAATYSPATYGARLNCEHIKSLAPDSVFGSYGDVLALSAEEVEIAGTKKLALFAEIDPTESLIALNKKRQKIYTSAEIHPKLAITGKPYLVGLAITDNPASLGTEALQFSAQHGTFASRKQDKDNLFTAAEEVVLEFEEVTEPENKAMGLFNRVMEALGKSKDKSVKDDAQFSELTEAVEALANHAQEQGSAFASEQTKLTALKTAHEKLAGEFADLVKRLGDTEDHSQHPRPPVKGGDGKVLTQF